MRQALFSAAIGVALGGLIGDALSGSQADDHRTLLTIGILTVAAAAWDMVDFLRTHRFVRRAAK